MKKIGFIFMFMAILLGLSSCHEEIKQCAGKIKSLNDTVMITSIGDYDITFDIKKAECTHGAVMEGDSVKVDYIGDLKDRKCKALLLYLIPKKGRVVNAVYDPYKKLETSPMSDEERKELQGFVNAVKHKK